MLSTPELEKWCHEQLERVEAEKEAEGDDDDSNEEFTPGAASKEAACLREEGSMHSHVEANGRLEVRETTKGGEGYREVVRARQLVCTTFRVWRREENERPLGSSPLSGSPAEPLFEQHKGIYCVAAPEPPAAPGSGVDDLDEWLQLPPPCAAKKAEWCSALDDCLLTLARHEACRFETRKHGGWLIEAEIHEIFVERDVVDTTSARAVAFGTVSGYAKTRRLNGGDAIRPKDVTDGCVAYGTLVVVHMTGDVESSWFGVQAWSSTTTAMLARIGDGCLSEGFEAALCQCGEGTTHRIVVAGDFLLADEATSRHVGDDAIVCVEVSVDHVDASASRKDVMHMTMNAKEARSVELKDRGAKLWAAGRFRRAELVWHDGVRLFNFIKPEDSGFDPHDFHLKENERGRRAAIPLLLNEALALRKRGALDDAKTNLDEAIDNDGNHVKALFRRGQLRIDLLDFEGARDDFRRCLDLGGPQAQVDNELKRLRKIERQHDAKAGKYYKGAFNDSDLYRDKSVDPEKLAKRRREIREAKERPPPSRANVVKRFVGPTSDWTASYDTKARPKIVTDSQPTASDRSDALVVENLEAEFQDVEEEEMEAYRQAKEDYYNTQIGLGNMRLHLPPDHGKAKKDEAAL